MATEAGLLAVITYLESAGYRGRVMAEDAPVWANILGDISDATVMRAAQAYCRTWQPFPPTPGQLYEIVRPPHGEPDEVDIYGNVTRRGRLPHRALDIPQMPHRSNELPGLPGSPGQLPEGSR